MTIRGQLHLRLALVAVTLVGNVSAQTPTAVPAELAGTTWRWTGSVSPVETVVVDAPERYTLAFLPEGRIALRADCNRANAGVTWPEPGTLRVGPMAMTRALCPPGSLSDRYVQDVGRAAGYAILDGALQLRLPDDGGTLRFMRDP
jgi:para-nitrobenzyl esterase